jgi:hypothetical protein
VAVPIGQGERAVENFLLVNVRREAPESPTEVALREQRFLVGHFEPEKGEFEMVVDRKVDRDLVERLFNQSRARIRSLSEKIRDLVTLSGKVAT